MKGGHDCTALRAKAVRPQNAIGNACLILDRDEQPLTELKTDFGHKDNPGDLNAPAIADIGDVGAARERAAPLRPAQTSADALAAKPAAYSTIYAAIAWGTSATAAACRDFATRLWM